MEPLPDLDEAGLVEHLEVPAEVAVGQVAEFLEVGEDDAAGVGDQRGHDAQPGLLVEDALQPLVGEAAGDSSGVVLGGVMIPLQGAVEHGGREQLAHAEGKAHGPGAQGVFAPREGQVPSPLIR